jgi:hypothetical protein
LEEKEDKLVKLLEDQSEMLKTLLVNVSSTSASASSSEGSTSVTVPARQPPRQQTFTQKYILQSHCTLNDFLVDYFRCGLQLTKNWDVGKTKSGPQNKSDTLQLFDDVCGGIAAHDRAALKKEMPAGDSTDYETCLNARTVVAQRITHKYIAKLQAREDLLFQKKRKRTCSVNTSALWARLKKVRKEEKEIQKRK